MCSLYLPFFLFWKNLVHLKYTKTATDLPEINFSVMVWMIPVACKAL